MFVLMLCQHPSSFDYDWLDQSWIDISIIIRIAQTMGMHRDPQWFSIDEYEREERRRIWYLLQYFDLYLTITHGLPTIIRQGTMDVMSPAHANLSDVAKRCRYFEEFDPLNPLPKDSIDSSSSDYLNNDRHKNIRFIPVKSEPFTVRTDVSFSLARSKLSMMGVWIYTETTNLQTPNMSYEKFWNLITSFECVTTSPVLIFENQFLKTVLPKVPFLAILQLQLTLQALLRLLLRAFRINQEWMTKLLYF